MRDLREAAREGHHALLVSLWRFPKRHPAMIAGVAATLAFCLLFFGLVDTQRDVRGLRPRIERVESGDPCVELSQAVKEQARKKVGPLTRQCISFLDALGPLISLKLSCAILDEGGYPCPRPGSGIELQANSKELQNLEVGATDTPSQADAPSVPDQTSGPGAGGRGVPGGTKKGHKPSKQSPGSPPPAPAPEASPAAPSQPGNSGKGASAEHGLDVCVELVMSACVKADVGP